LLRTHATMDAIFPSTLDWFAWLDRWDRMQERYLVARSERFRLIADVVAACVGDGCRIVDLGCGTGSLSAVLLGRLPDARVVGIDLDSTLLPLAERRLERFASRATLLRADLRDPLRMEAVPGPFDAAVSATALHWVSADTLSRLYRDLAGLLRPGGVFLNADHVASESPVVQEHWLRERQAMRDAEGTQGAEDWHRFWDAYLAGLGPEAGRARANARGDWEGVEDGMPLAWHFDRLRAAGFTAVDCFWRCGPDAIYGAVKAQQAVGCAARND